MCGLFFKQWLLTLVFLLTVTACGGGGNNTDNNSSDTANSNVSATALSVTHIQAVLPANSAATIDHVTVALEQTPQITAALTKDANGEWEGALEHDFVGQQNVIVKAFSATGEEIFTGTAQSQLAAGDENTITVMLAPIAVGSGGESGGNTGGGSGGEGTAPTIGYVSSTVDSAGLVHLTVGAKDFDAGDSLTYQWSAPADSTSGFF